MGYKRNDMQGDKSKHEEDRVDENPANRMKMITPAIWGGETMKTVRVI